MVDEPALRDGGRLAGGVHRLQLLHRALVRALDEQLLHAHARLHLVEVLDLLLDGLLLDASVDVEELDLDDLALRAGGAGGGEGEGGGAPLEEAATIDHGRLLIP